MLLSLDSNIKCFTNSPKSVAENSACNKDKAKGTSLKPYYANTTTKSKTIAGNTIFLIVIAFTKL